MKLIFKCMLKGFLMILLIPFFAKAECKAAFYEKREAVVSQVNQTLLSQGQQKLNHEEVRLLLNHIKEVVMSPVRFVDYLINMRKYKEELCHAYGGSCVPDKISQF